MIHCFSDYDLWKTTPPDWYYGTEMTPEEEERQWFDDWERYIDDYEYEESLEADYAKA